MTSRGVVITAVLAAGTMLTIMTILGVDYIVNLTVSWLTCILLASFLPIRSRRTHARKRRLK